MAHLLANLGKEALKPQKVGNVWHKAIISAKNAARLRKEALLAGRYACFVDHRRHLLFDKAIHTDSSHVISRCFRREWEFDEPRKEAKSVKRKGHKHDRLKPQRYIYAFST